MKRTSQTSLRNWFSVLSYALVIITFVKIFWVVFGSSFMGYANNYDFIRQESCAGVWQSYPAGKPKTEGNPEAPVNNLIFDGEKIEGGCLESVDNVFVLIASQLHTVGDSLSFRDISIWKILAFSVAFLVLFLAIREGLHRFAVSLALFLVFGDFVQLLYVNTMYLEFSVIASLFIGVISSIFLVTTEKNRAVLFALTTLSIIWLGLSKQQYMPLAILIGLTSAALLLLIYKKFLMGLALALVSIAIPLGYGLMVTDSPVSASVRYANNTDTVLWAVLPEASDKDEALAKLGLSSKCAEGIGKSWYTPGVQEDHPCPQLENFNRIKLVPLFVSQPQTFLEPMVKASIGVHPFYPSYLGHLEDPGFSEHWGYKLLKQSSLSFVLAKAPSDTVPYFVAVSSLLALLAFVKTAVVLLGRMRLDPFILFVLYGGVIVFYSVASSVFGDGYAELQKHAVGFLIGFSFQLVGLLFLLLMSLQNHLVRRRNPDREFLGSSSNVKVDSDSTFGGQIR